MLHSVASPPLYPYEGVVNRYAFEIPVKSLLGCRYTNSPQPFFESRVSFFFFSFFFFLEVKNGTFESDNENLSRNEFFVFLFLCKMELSPLPRLIKFRREINLIG